MSWFDHAADRSETASVKWNFLSRLAPGAKDPLPFWVADMEFEVLPDIQEALKTRLAKPVYSYTETTEAFYEGVRYWYRSRHGLELEREEILPVSGVLTALASALAAFTEPGDAVILCKPVYNPFFEIVEGLGRRVAEAPLLEGDRWEMDYAAIETRMQEGAKAMLLCSPHNPVGRVWRKDELLPLVELCERYDVLLISDEIHSDIVIGSTPHTPILAVRPESRARILLLNAPSKTFNIAAMGVAYVLCRDRELRHRLLKQMQPFHSEVNFLGAAALQAAYTDNGAAWVDALREQLRRNVSLTVRTFSAKLPPVKITPCEGTFLMWLDFSAYRLNQEELIKKLSEEAGVVVNNGSMYGAAREGFVRFNIGCPEAMLKEALDRIVRVFGTGSSPRPPRFRGRDNIPVCVYGPPSWFGKKL